MQSKGFLSIGLSQDLKGNCQGKILSSWMAKTTLSSCNMIRFFGGGGVGAQRALVCDVNIFWYESWVKYVSLQSSVVSKPWRYQGPDSNDYWGLERATVFHLTNMKCSYKQSFYSKMGKGLTTLMYCLSGALEDVIAFETFGSVAPSTLENRSRSSHD